MSIQLAVPFKPGDPRAQCDRCGFPFHLSQLRKEWTNSMVCPKCWNPRHPQEFIKGIPDQQAVPNSRHIPTDAELTYLSASIRPQDVE